MALSFVPGPFQCVGGLECMHDTPVRSYGYGERWSGTGPSPGMASQMRQRLKPRSFLPLLAGCEGQERVPHVMHAVSRLCVCVSMCQFNVCIPLQTVYALYGSYAGPCL